MLTGHRRTGGTLAELLVAMTLAGIVLGAATSTLLRQQRIFAALRRTASEDTQLRASLGALSVELAALGAGTGDLAEGQATDTAVQLRSLVATGLACGDAMSSATFVGGIDGDAGALSGAAPRVGDSLWWFGGSPPEWLGRRIVASDSVAAPCPLTGGPSGPARRLVIAEPDSIGYGTPVRVTRPARYGFYRSGDGSWQLGVREWVDVTGRFASPQPIAGPFLMRAGKVRTGFRYFDARGMELGIDGDVIPSGRVARVRITVMGADSSTGGGTATSRDSLDVALQVGAGP